MTNEKPVPANIKEFDEITAVILGELYKSHPHPKTIDPAEIARLLGVSPDDKLPSGRTFTDMFFHTLMWLADEGFVNDLAAIQPYRCRLTARTLGGMKGNRGSEMIDATNEGSSQAGKMRIAELMGEFWGTFTGAVVKSLSGP
jgi:hypothetical protein